MTVPSNGDAVENRYAGGEPDVVFNADALAGKALALNGDIERIEIVIGRDQNARGGDEYVVADFQSAVAIQHAIRVDADVASDGNRTAVRMQQCAVENEGAVANGNRSGFRATSSALGLDVNPAAEMHVSADGGSMVNISPMQTAVDSGQGVHG